MLVLALCLVIKFVTKPEDFLRTCKQARKQFLIAEICQEFA